MIHGGIEIECGIESQNKGLHSMTIRIKMSEISGQIVEEAVKLKLEPRKTVEAQFSEYFQAAV